MVLTVRIRDLGPVVVEHDGLLEPVGSGRVASALSLLCERVGFVVTTAALVDAVWGEVAPARAGQLLETLVWRLRKVLEPGRAAWSEAAVLRRDPQGYRLDVPVNAVDSAILRSALTELRTLTAAGRHTDVLDQSAAVLGLWRGEPWAEVVDAPWVVPARLQLLDARLDIAEVRVDALLSTGRPEEAVDELRPLLAQQPFRERFWAQRMLALYRTGRQGEALTSFSEARAVLDGELGIEPGPQLRGLHRRILAQDPALEPKLAHPTSGSASHRGTSSRLPRPRHRMIGRDTLLGEVRRSLPVSSLITLTGPGGVGKTRLALAVAEREREAFTDGAWFVDLAVVEDGAYLPAAFAGALALADRQDADALELVVAFLSTRQALLVVDNCEHLVERAAAGIDEILERCPGVRILATSREPLEVAGEQVVAVPPLSTESSAAAGTGTAVAMFLSRLPGAHDEPSDTSEGEVVSRICRAVGGLPLGLELAAAQARSFELAEIAEALERNPAALGRPGPGPRRQATLRDTVEWGYRLATRDEQTLHGRLSVLPGQFTLDVAAALCALPPLHPDRAMELVGGLVHRSLLVSTRPAAEPAPTAFTQLPPIRAHARLTLTPDTVGAVTDERDRWFANRVLAVPPDGRPGSRDTAAWLDQNTALTRAVLESTLVTRPRREGIDLVCALVAYWFSRGQLVEAAHWAARVQDVVGQRRMSDFDRALAAATVGGVEALRHDRDRAGPRLRAAFPALLHPPADRSAMTGVALLLVAASAWTGDLGEEAAAYARGALTFAQAQGQTQLAVGARAIQAASRTFTEGRSTGIAEATAVLADNASVGNDYAELFALVTLAVAGLVEGRATDALAASDQLLVLHRSMGAVAVSDTLETRASIRVLAGDDGEAVRCLGASASLNSQHGREWPWHQFTPPVLADLQQRLSPSDFDRYWTSGQRLGLGDPRHFTPDWI